MLVLSRKKNQKISISGGITITLIEIKGDTVKLGISAPPEVDILRDDATVTTRTKARRRAGKDTR